MVIENGSDAGITPARLAAAAALRRLGNAFVAHQVPDDALDALTTQIDALVATIEQAPLQPNAFFSHEAGALAELILDPDAVPPNSLFPNSLVSGPANPMGMDATLERVGEEAVMEVTLGPAFEGAPGRAHGGVVAALFDETMGLALSVTATMAFTGRLTITYRAPTPLGIALTVRARLAHRSDRKITITGELRSDDALLAEAEGLFIAVDPNHFLGTPQP